MNRLFFVIVLCIGFAMQQGCNSNYTSIKGESVVVAGSEPTVLLLPDIVQGSVVVRNKYLLDAEGAHQYKEGHDFTIDYEMGTITRCEGSRIPDYSSHCLYGVEKFRHEKYANFKNHSYFAWVDYKSTKEMAIPDTVNQSDILKKSFSKLSTGKPFKIIVFGDSISTGAEATENRHAFFSIFKKSLDSRYPLSEIAIENGSTGGDTTVQGLERLSEKVLIRKPDLVLVGFGMNDHNVNSVNPDDYHANLKAIVQTIKDQTGADVILYSTFPPNPNWAYGSHRMGEYAGITKKVAHETNCAYADVYSVWKYVLERKDISSLLGNNINHPNNFSHWLYSLAFDGIL